jgi:hypothetical protein
MITAVQTAWRVGNDAVEAGSNLVPVCIPWPFISLKLSSIILLALKKMIFY